MNYLAHLLLGSTSDGRLIGSLLGDFCRGRLEGLPYSGELLEGIRLHRRIDSLTDSHPLVAASRARFNSQRRLAGVAIDLAFDHFLARHWQRYSPLSLEAFAESSYRTLANFAGPAPEPFAQVVHYMAAENWLCGYRDFAAIAHALKRIEHRRPRLVGLAETIDELDAHYHALERDFFAFFPLLQSQLDSELE